MTKYRHIKNVKHALRKARNRVRRLGDSWYSKEHIMKQRKLGKQEIDDQVKSRAVI